MKYYFCKADIGENMPYYELIIKAQNKKQAEKRFTKFVYQDYADYTDYKEPEIWAEELTQDYIIKNSF